MSTKAKVAEVGANEPKPETTPPPVAQRNRATKLEDIPVYESLIDRKFKRRDGKSPHDVFTPIHIFEEYLMEADEMESSAICARFCVQRSSNGNGETEPATQLIFGREIRARRPANEFFQDCARFVELHEEVRE
jgi:hypothetical protein